MEDSFQPLYGNPSTQQPQPIANTPKKLPLAAIIVPAFILLGSVLLAGTTAALLHYQVVALPAAVALVALPGGIALPASVLIPAAILVGGALVAFIAFVTLYALLQPSKTNASSPTTTNPPAPAAKTTLSFTLCGDRVTIPYTSETTIQDFKLLAFEQSGYKDQDNYTITIYAWAGPNQGSYPLPKEVYTQKLSEFPDRIDSVEIELK